MDLLVQGQPGLHSEIPFQKLKIERNIKVVILEHGGGCVCRDSSSVKAYIALAELRFCFQDPLMWLLIDGNSSSEGSPQTLSMHILIAYPRLRRYLHWVEGGHLAFNVVNV